MKKIALWAIALLPMVCAAQTEAELKNKTHDEMMELVTDLYDEGNTKEAERVLQFMIGRGDVEAYGTLAQVRDKKGTHGSKWRKTLEQGGKVGCKSCLNALGDYYYEEKNDYTKAAQYYGQAADGEGLFSTAIMILNGDYPDKSADTVEALQMMKSSVAMGYVANGARLLGMVYAMGELVEENQDSAAHYFAMAANAGDERSMMWLATSYERGRGVAIDTAEAIRWHLAAADAGMNLDAVYAADLLRDSRCCRDTARARELYNQASLFVASRGLAIYRLAEYHLKGIGTAVDTVAALPMLKEAAALDNGDAADLLGQMYQYGRCGLPVNMDSAYHYYKIASDNDNPHGDYIIGQAIAESGDYGRAYGFLASAYDNGSVEAKLMLAQMALYGSGMEQNPAQAMEWLKEVAASADSLILNAQVFNLLGAASYLGAEGEPDVDAARRHFEHAAHYGNSVSMMALGEIYANGKGVVADSAKAIEYYEQAVAAGNVRAMMRLANTYAEGGVTPRNPKRAAELWQMAADQGNTDAMCYLGRCYEEGEGVVLNSRRAFSLYKQAADDGSAWGMRLVGYCYGKGIYVDADIEKAFEWFLRAAEEGDSYCQYLVGLCYAEGEGVKKNKKEARRWLTLAADAGIEEAAAYLYMNAK